MSIILVIYFTFIKESDLLNIANTCILLESREKCRNYHGYFRFMQENDKSIEILHIWQFYEKEVMLKISDI